MNEDASDFYQHDVVGSEFVDQAYRELQRKYPVGVSHDVAPVVAVSLLDEPRAISQVDLDGILSELNLPAVVTPIDAMDERVENAFAIRFQTGSVWIATGKGSFDEDWKLADETSELAPLVEDHRAWIAIGTAAWSPLAREQANAVARAVYLALAEQTTPASCIRDDSYWEQYLLLPGRSDLLEKWQATGELWELRNETQTLQSSYDPRMVSERRAYTRALRQAVRRYGSSPDARLTVWASPANNLAIAPLEIQVSDVEHTYGSFAFMGTLVSSSVLIPELQAGLPMRMDQHQIVAWQLDAEPRVHRP